MFSALFSTCSVTTTNCTTHDPRSTSVRTYVGLPFGPARRPGDEMHVVRPPAQGSLEERQGKFEELELEDITEDYDRIH